MSATLRERQAAVRERVAELLATIGNYDRTAAEHERAIREKRGLDLQLAMAAVTKYNRASASASRRLEGALKDAEKADRIHDAEVDVKAVQKTMPRLHGLLTELDEARMQTAFAFPRESP